MCGCSIMVEHQLPKLRARVRFPSPAPSAFRSRLEYISYVQDNFGVMPLKNTEDVLQLTTALTGFSENVELFYLLISAKTDIPYTELMGKSAEGMNATGQGDRKKWYDKCKSIQDTYKPQLLTMFVFYYLILPECLERERRALL